MLSFTGKYVKMYVKINLQGGACHGSLANLLTRRTVCTFQKKSISRAHAIVLRSYNSSTGFYTCWDPWSDSQYTFTDEEFAQSNINLNDGVYRQINCVIFYH